MDIKQSDLGLLVALDALLEQRNVTRAAETLNISQPAMSAQLARLRDLFGDPLLVASGRQMVPTSRAMALQERLRQNLEELSHLVRERQPFNPERSARVFKISAPDYLHLVATQPLLSEVSKNAPNVQISLLPFDPRSAWPMLENLETDALVVWKEGTPEEARAKKLYVEQRCLVQRKGHPRGRKKLDLDTLCSLDHAVIAKQAGMLQGDIDEQLRKLGRKRRVVVSAPSILAMPALVANSNLVATIPRRLAELSTDELEIFELPLPKISYEILLSWHPRLQADPGHKWFRDLIVADTGNR